MAILAPLKELDAVAYLRFASVYRNFASLADFEGEISLLREFPTAVVTPATNQESKTVSPRG